jgi:hypothetical protein
MPSVILSVLIALLALAGCAGSDSNPLGTAGSAGSTVLNPVVGQSPTGGGGAGGSSVIPPMTPMQNPPTMMPPNMMASGRGGAGGGGGAGMGGAGLGGAGMPAGGMTGGGGTAGMDAPVGEPIIPMVAGECPNFSGGSISLMGLSGISVEAGSKASGPTAPMLFYWHGTGSFAGEYAGHTTVVRGITGEGGVVISFGGTTGGDLLSGTAIFGRGDFDLTDQLVACAVQNQNVDPKRIFTTGCSAGGLFAGAMAAARSNYMAASAPNSGGWTAPVMFQNNWTPALMTIHGAPGLDVVIIDFSNSSMTADNAFKMRGGFVINCNHGGGHCGGGGLDPDIWEFFKAHPYGTKPSPWAGGLPSGFNSDCKIF